MTRVPIIYGTVIFAALFLVGHFSGLGGPFWMNFGFSAVMGVLFGLNLWLFKKYSNKGGDE